MKSIIEIQKLYKNLKEMSLEDFINGIKFVLWSTEGIPCTKSHWQYIADQLFILNKIAQIKANEYE